MVRDLENGKMVRWQQYLTHRFLHLCYSEDNDPWRSDEDLLLLPKCKRLHRLVVRTSHRGRDNPGSTPGGVSFEPVLQCLRK